MKRRSFLQWCLGVLGLAGVPKAEGEAYTREDIEAASGYNEEISPPQNCTEHAYKYSSYDPQILDICSERDYIYVLLEGGFLWRAWKGGELFGKPFLTWQMVHQYPWIVEKLKIQNPNWIIGIAKIHGEECAFGGYLIEA